MHRLGSIGVEAIKLFGRYGRVVGLSGSLIPFFLISYSAIAQNDPPVVQTSSQEWERSAEQRFEASMQVGFDSHRFAHHQDVVAALMVEIPRYFPHLKLNTIGRGLHTTLLYLEQLDLEGARKVVRVFSELTKEELHRWNLDQEYKIFDPDNIEIMRVGTQSIFLALKPHPTLIQWQTNFWRMIQDKLPRLFERSMASRMRSGRLDEAIKRIHISLVQFGDRFGLGLSEDEVERETELLREVVQRTFRDLKEKNGGVLPGNTGSLRTHAVELVLPPAHFKDDRFIASALTMDLSGKPFVAPVFRWRSSHSDRETTIFGQATDLPDKSPASVNEVLTEDLLSDAFPQNGTVDSGRSRRTWVDAPKHYPGLDEASIVSGISDQLADALRTSARFLSPDFSPAPHSIEVAMGGKKQTYTVYTAQMTHPYLDPAKAAVVVPYFQRLGFDALNEDPQVSTGGCIYASGVRRDISNPSDLDLLQDVLIHVPEEITDYDAARKFAVRKFTQSFFATLRGRIRDSEVEVVELRVGSDWTMGLEANQPKMSRLLSNPYLSHTNVMNGTYTDRAGKVWSLEDLVGLGDFIKLKLDMYRNGKRQPISFQFFVGFSWGKRDARKVVSLHQHGWKGVPPLMRTAVYMSEEGYATAMALSRPDAYYTVQRGPILAAAIRDLMESAFKGGGLASIKWNSKFLKRFNNLLLLFDGSGLSQQEVFVRQALNELGLSDFAVDEVLHDLAPAIREAINQPELAITAKARAILNDIYEHAEMGHGFGQVGVQIRIEELKEYLESLTHALKNGSGVKVGSPKRHRLLEKIRRFESALEGLREAFDQKETSVGTRFVPGKWAEEQCRAFESVMYDFDEALLTQHRSNAAALDPFFQTVIEAVVRILPSKYIQYIEARLALQPNIKEHIEELKKHWHLRGLEKWFFEGARKKLGRMNTRRINTRIINNKATITPSLDTHRPRPRAAAGRCAIFM